MIPATNELNHGPQPTRRGLPCLILNLPTTKGKPKIHENGLRPMLAMLSKEDELAAWRQTCNAVELQTASQISKSVRNYHVTILQ